MNKTAEELTEETGILHEEYRRWYSLPAQYFPHERELAWEMVAKPCPMNLCHDAGGYY